MQAGDLIQDRYELRESIGRGGMAEVWVGRDAHLERDVAIKFLAPRLADDPEFLVRFFAEAQVVAGISHPNVVQVLDFGEHEGRPYLVMEFVEGGSVADLTGMARPENDAVPLIAGAARGAGAAHGNAIVHRDLKPGNILLDRERTPKIADFGIAASTRSERLTATGAAIGSPHYISPEQATGGEPTPASDVYALGVVLYELLTGAKPFDADNVTAIAIAHVDEAPRPPSELTEISPAIEAIVMRCLAKDPEERFSDGNELAVALDAIAVSPSAPVAAAAVAPVTVGATTVDVEPEPSPRPTRRALVGAALALVVVGGAAVAVFARGDGVEQRERGAAETLEDVGDLGGSPTPSVDAELAAAEEPKPDPSPTKTKKKKKDDAEKTTKKSPSSTDDDSTGGSSGDDHDSGSDGSDDTSPSPEPTDDATPAPQPTPQPTP